MHLFLAAALTLMELQGHWITARYADALADTRSPMRAARVARPVAFDFLDFRLADVTNFHKGLSRNVVSVDSHSLVVSPYQGPKEKTTRLPLKVTRGPNGGIATIHVQIWPNEPSTFRPIDVDAQTYARRVVIAGTYTDARGVKWVFNEHGDRWVGGQWEPDYSVGLDTRDACCDYLNFGEERVGFRWRAGKLLLYKILEVPVDCPSSCAKEPYVVLTPVK